MSARQEPQVDAKEQMLKAIHHVESLIARAIGVHGTQGMSEELAMELRDSLERVLSWKDTIVSRAELTAARDALNRQTQAMGRCQVWLDGNIPDPSDNDSTVLEYSVRNLMSDLRSINNVLARWRK